MEAALEESPAVPDGGEAPRASCRSHPDAEAVATCERCGSFLCAGCRVVEGTRSLCERCRIALLVEGRPSALAMAAGILGAVGLCLGFVPGVVALVLAHVELKRIARGRSPGAGRHWAETGRALGLLNIVLGVLAGLGLLLTR